MKKRSRALISRFALTAIIAASILSCFAYTTPTYADSSTGVLPCATTPVNGTCTATNGGIESVDANGNPIAPQANVSVSGDTVSANATVGSNCSLFGPGSWFTNCVWIPMMSWLGSWFLTIGGFFLVLAGVLFDWLVSAVIINFAGTLNTMGATAAITTGWTVFRDLSNIVIIGMFTFIAIATILGNTEYGYKKMLSRVLIVAVLINFSLLFSKIIIDVGNFTAYQVYQTIATSPQFAASQTAPQAGGATGQFDIASAFLRPMGITSIWDTQGVLQQFGETSNSGMQAFMIGLVGGLLLMMLAIVLLYGCFLIASRAVLLIILMITASIAFASHLHPTLSDSQFGWSGWWKSLINASLFAPLLMVFLAISLLIIQGASTIVITQGTQQGAIGAAVFNALSSPTAAAAGNGWTVIMLYIFGIGLLFASFKLSSSFASSIGGFNFAQSFLSAPIAAVNRFGIAPAMRNLPWIGGRGAAARAQTLDKEVEKESRAQARLPEQERNLSKLTDLMRQKSKAETRAKSTFDIGNSGLGQRIAKGIKVPGVLTAKTTTNFAESSKKTAEEAAKAATEVAVSKKDAEAVARKEVDQGTDLKSQELKEKRASDQKLVDQVRTIAETTKKNEKIDDRMKGAQQEFEKAQGQAIVEKTKAAADPRLNEQQRTQIFREQDEHIKRARADVENIQKRVEAIHKDTGLTDAEARLKETNKEIDKHVEERAKVIRGNSADNAQQVGANLTQNWVQRTLVKAGVNVATDTVTAKKARSMVKKKVNVKDLQAREQARQDLINNAGEGGTSGSSAAPTIH